MHAHIINGLILLAIIAAVVALYCSAYSRGVTDGTDSGYDGGFNAGKSAGLRLVTSPRSVTTSSSTHFAPAFARSVLKDGHDVITRPFTASASISVHGP